MNELVLAGLLGGVGGLTRGVVGLLKALALKRKILWTYWAITVRQRRKGQVCESFRKIHSEIYNICKREK